MFDYDIRELQYEDVGYVHPKDASYGPIKDRLDMREIDSLLKNEEMADRERKIPMRAGGIVVSLPI